MKSLKLRQGFRSNSDYAIHFACFLKYSPHDDNTYSQTVHSKTFVDIPRICFV